MTEERHARLMAEYGFDKPIIVQYGHYLNDLIHGNFGVSIVTKQPVLEEFITLFPATVELSACAILFAVFIGLPVGMVAAVRRGSAFDHTVMAGALTGYSMPIFWWGLLLIIFFSGILGWTPVSGRISLLYYFEPVTGFMLIDSLLSGQDGAFASAVSHLILPTVVLGTIPAGGYCPPDPFGDARGAWRGLYQDCPGQRLATVQGDRSARAAQCDDSGNHGDRPAGRRAVCRGDPDRDHFLLAGDRQMDGRFYFQTGLCLSAGRPAPDSSYNHDC
jgi:hypothetical protein